MPAQFPIMQSTTACWAAKEMNRKNILELCIDIVKTQIKMQLLINVFLFYCHQHLPSWLQSPLTEKWDREVGWLATRSKDTLF